MRLKPTLNDTAAFFECHPDTVEKYVKATWNLSFPEFRDQNMVHTRYSIIRKAIQKAEAGDNVMLIFCLKNLCGWKDRHELTGADNGSVIDAIRVNVTLPANGREAKLEPAKELSEGEGK